MHFLWQLVIKKKTVPCPDEMRHKEPCICAAPSGRKICGGQWAAGCLCSPGHLGGGPPDDPRPYQQATGPIRSPRPSLFYRSYPLHLPMLEEEEVKVYSLLRQQIALYRGKICEELSKISSNSPTNECNSKSSFSEIVPLLLFREKECVGTLISSNNAISPSHHVAKQDETLNEEKLNLLLQAAEKLLHSSERDQINDGVTPLMVCCDKGLSNILEGLLRKISVEESTHTSTDSTFKKVQILISILAIGHPYDRSSASVCGGNTAAHYAAYANSVDCFKMLLHWEEKQVDNLSHTNSSSSFGLQSNKILDLTNAHGDTPFMMAVMTTNYDATVNTNNSTMELIRYILSKQTKYLNRQQHIASLLQKENHSGDTALSLAYGHGKLDILREMVLSVSCKNDRVMQNLLLPLFKRHVERCQKALTLSRHYIDLKNKNNVSSDNLEQLLGKTSRVEACLGLLNEAYTKQQAFAEEEACRNMRELLLLEEDPKLSQSSNRQRKVGKQVSKRKKKMGIKNSESTEVLVEPKAKNPYSIHNGNDSNTSSSDTASFINTPTNGFNCALVPASSGEAPSTVPTFITLMNGSLISAQDASFTATGEEDVSHLPNSTSQPSPSRTKVEKDNTNLIYQKFLELCPEAGSLCLDPSMLLLTSQNMAILLSPCQLEAIERLLEKQLESTREAQQIHKRVWDGFQKNGIVNLK